MMKEIVIVIIALSVLGLIILYKLFQVIEEDTYLRRKKSL